MEMDLYGFGTELMNFGWKLDESQKSENSRICVYLVDLPFTRWTNDTTDSKITESWFVNFVMRPQCSWSASHVPG